MKHTPGPWTEDICTRGPDGQPIQVCTKYAWLHGEGTEEYYRNAVLISKAPEMLKELKKHCEGCKAQRLEYEHTFAFTPCSECSTQKLINEIEGD
jgi:hypothetical protein